MGRYVYWNIQGREMLIKPLLKITFISLCCIWYYISKNYFSDDSMGVIWVGFVLYCLGIHWMYSYIFNSDMHYNIGKIKPNEEKIIRLCGFIFAIGLCIFITYPKSM